ncbi:MAG TPA: oxygen-independent coproporphyrinogen III oxidase, partial [Candidatus Eisenbacteria bacterium]|nr:oxygen-independent coproporphyrinogen III oxidase [Candidatus Eisenbacteria bacterium]
MSQLQVDLALVQKYNVPGPRYTSYPPATKFAEQVTWPQMAEKILENNQTARDLSIYFHIPFCETLCWFCGCTTVITTQHSKSAPYLERLKKEVAQMTTLLNPRRKMVQLHFGGGTPTFLPPEEIRALGDLIHSNFQMAEDVEAGVEIDPRRLTRDHLVALREVGFNRVSMGVQDFDAEVQEAVHRIQPYAMTKQVLEWVRALGFKSINLDLIYGLPHQTVASFEKTLEQVLTLGPDRLAIFSYAHVPWVKPAQKILEQKVLPSAEVKLQILKLTIEKLTAAGYVYIGMDHFAREDDELAVAQRQKTLQRNFQGYSTRAGADIYAFGMSSISQIPDAYWQNEKELPKYYAALDAGKVPLTRGYLLTDEDKIRRETIMRVMCDLSLDYAAMSLRLGLNFASHFEREIESLASLEADGLVRRSPTGLEVTDTGRLFIRNVAMCFDNALAPASE